MKLDTLFDNYDLLMDSPNSTVTMRKLILQLAVQGKLAPQDPNDEPAGELLKRIKAEKEKLIAEGKIKKQKPLPPVAEDEILYELPQGWEWVRLGEITNYGASNKVEPDNVKDDETWVLELEDIEKTTSILLKKVRYKDRPFKSTKNVFLSGDVLYGKLRPYLDKVLVADEDGICTTEILPLRSEIINPYYLRYSLKRKDFLEYVDSVVYGMKMPRLGTKDGQVALIPLPPLAEQHRIVAKVDQLMHLCDELENRLNQSKKDSEMLMQAVLYEAFS